METKKAVLKVLKDTGKSRYWIAKQIEVNPIMVSHYIRENKPCRMSVKTAAKFKEAFDIEITNAYNPIKEVVDDTTSIPGRE